MSEIRVRVGHVAGLVVIALMSTGCPGEPPGNTSAEVAATVAAAMDRDPDIFDASEAVSPVTSDGNGMSTLVEGTEIHVPRDPSLGITVQVEELGVVRIGLPLADKASAAEVVRPGVLAYDNGDGSITSPSMTASGVSINTVIQNSTAPNRYAYPMTMPPGARLVGPTADDPAMVVGAEGDIILWFQTPWAVDNAGVGVDTHFEVVGQTLVQVVDHNASGTAYPVIADPGMGWWQTLQCLVSITAAIVTLGLPLAKVLKAAGNATRIKTLVAAGNGSKLKAIWSGLEGLLAIAGVVEDCAPGQPNLDKCANVLYQATAGDAIKAAWVIENGGFSAFVRAMWATGGRTVDLFALLGDAMYPIANKAYVINGCFKGRVPGPPPGASGQLSMGEGHACAITPSKSLKCWGMQSGGVLGFPTVDVPDGLTVSTPTLVPGVSNVRQVDTDGLSTCVVIDDGTVKCWGFLMATYAPTPIAGITNAKQVSVSGLSHACAVLDDGGVVCWGWGARGRLGNGAAPEAMVLVPVRAVGITNAVEVDTGSTHSCALLDSQGVMCWGANEYGQLGDILAQGLPRRIDSSVPVGVAYVSGATEIELNDRMSCAAVYNGGVMCWGLVQGTGATVAHTVLSGTSGLFHLSANSSDLPMCALRGGEIVCWSPWDQTVLPTPALKNTVDIAASSRSNTICAMSLNRSINCWGDNMNGEFGNGTNTPSATPTPVLNWP